jgi:hypothetical protein
MRGKSTGGRFPFPKEGILMRSRLWLSVLSALALTPLGFSTAHAGSFFGPCCYGAGYTNQYPNRSHNVFGCNDGSSCTARHPLFKHRWLRKHQNAPVNEPPMMYGEPMNVAPPPVVQAPMPSVQFQTTSNMPSMTTATPAVSSRIVPIPAGRMTPASPEPPLLDASGKPPF